MDGVGDANETGKGAPGGAKRKAILAAIAVVALLAVCMGVSCAPGSGEGGSSSQGQDQTAAAGQRFLIMCSVEAQGTSDATVKLHVFGTDANGEKVDRDIDVALNSAAMPLEDVIPGTYTLSFATPPASTDASKAFAVPQPKSVTLAEDGDVSVDFAFTLLDKAAADTQNEQAAAEVAAAESQASSTAAGSSSGGNAPASGGTSSGGASSSTAKTWVTDYTQVYVVDQAAYDETQPVYGTVAMYVCDVCGAAFSSAHAAGTHTATAHGGAGYHEEDQRVQTGTTTVHHDAVGHYETVASGGHWE